MGRASRPNFPMKRWIWPALFVWTLVGAVAVVAWNEDAPSAVVPAKGQIAWQSSFEAAMQTAKQEGKPALVVFGTKTCTYCKEMDKTTWRDARVEAQTRGWVPVRVDGDQRLDLLTAYDIHSFPTAVLVGGDGKPFAARDGYVPPDEFASFLEQARAKWKS